MDIIKKFELVLNNALSKSRRRDFVEKFTSTEMIKKFDKNFAKIHHKIF